MTSSKNLNYHSSTQDEIYWNNMSNYERIKTIEGNWLFLKYFKNQTEEEGLAGVRKSSNALQYIDNQTDRICFEAIRQNPLSLVLVKNKTIPICLEAVRLNPNALQYVPASLQTLEICEKALKIDGMCLKYVVNQTERLCYDSLMSSKGASFCLIKNQTKFLCKEAMKIDGNLLMYVVDQTFEICFEAVKKNSLAVRYVKFNLLNDKDIEAITYEAVKKNGNAIQYIDKKYHNQKCCVIALQADKNNIKYIDYEKFNISLINFEQKTIDDNIESPKVANEVNINPNNSLITVNQENYYIIKTNVINDCIKNVKLTSGFMYQEIFVAYVELMVEKIKSKRLIKNQEQTTNTNNTAPCDNTNITSGVQNVQFSDTGASSEVPNVPDPNTNQTITLKAKKTSSSTNQPQISKDSTETKIEIYSKKISDTKYEIYEKKTFTKYYYYFYKSLEEKETLLYSLELFKYTTGLIL